MWTGIEWFGTARASSCWTCFAFSTRLGPMLRVKRSIGGATPGLEAVAKLEIAIDPLTESTHLTGDVVAKVAGKTTPSRDLLFEASGLGFRFRHDRQWFVASEQREAISLRRIDRDDLVAQCTLTTLTPKSAGRQATLGSGLPVAGRGGGDGGHVGTVSLCTGKHKNTVRGDGVKASARSIPAAGPRRRGGPARTG